MTEWHILTGEYPPQMGGVGDYTQQIARGLAEAGDRVCVWAPPCHQTDDADGLITVRRLPDRWGWRSLRTLTRALDRLPAPRRLLVQYVPHAFGWKAANVPFCLWLRSRRRDQVWVMFHEVAFPFGRGESLARNTLAAVHRMMATLVGAAAERAFISIPAWRPDVQKLLGSRKPVIWLPVPSGIRVIADADASARIHARLAGDAPLVGHFSTYSPAIRRMLEASLPLLLERTNCHVLLLGRKSDAVRRQIAGRLAHLSERLHGAGAQAPADVSRHVSACDVMVQPYPDGVSTRRTTAMVSLAHGRPMVTTSGWLTETLWQDSGASVLVPAGEPAAIAAAAASLLDDARRRASLAERARATYDERFDVRHSIEALRSQEPVRVTPARALRDFRLS